MILFNWEAKLFKVKTRVCQSISTHDSVACVICNEIWLIVFYISHEEVLSNKIILGAATKHKPIYLVGLLWFDRMVHNQSLCAGLPRIFQYTYLSSHWPFPVKVYTNPRTIGFMLWKTQLLCGLVDWQNVPTQLLNGILGPSCLFFFVVWIVVTVSVRGDSPVYLSI